ncbi:sulfotransferase family 2 domain-containing protein [Gilvimarinus xylanilyticus]|uniref:Sulfotransferase family protein n=1 Tax=Gilvimarinus xylanilyticus TaxID=2944139 RepID=A0A9X2HYZ1_9GAMM|nr:sulfotransferase family 2 domain-containing protein [Gilvimarinus xylanilyticus]MCP8899649.1 sulfotransferase family protein [Gilvimarinus xylanilyticus]
MPSDFKKVKIVRNPYARAVSAYLHTLKRPELLHKDTAGQFNRMQYSFAEFIDTLERLEGKNIDPHYSPQTYDFERHAKWSYDWIIQLESCTEQLRELECAMDLGASPLEEFRESKHHSKRRTNSDKFVGHTSYRSGNIAHSAYPYFYNRDLVQRVHKLFKDDFSRYGYSDELELPHSGR